MLHSGPGNRLLLLTVATVALFAGAMVPRTASAHADPKLEGAQVFANAGCVYCHGAAGEGTKKGPALTGVRHKLTAEQIHHQIKDGGQNMPPFGEALDDAQIEQLVALLRAKRWPPIPPPASATPSTPPPTSKE